MYYEQCSLRGKEEYPFSLPNVKQRVNLYLASARHGPLAKPSKARHQKFTRAKANGTAPQWSRLWQCPITKIHHAEGGEEKKINIKIVSFGAILSFIDIVY